MNKEIEKIMFLKEYAMETEKKKLTEIEDVFAETFKAMISGAENFILNGEYKKATLREAKEALEWLHDFTSRMSIDKVEFPIVTSPQDVATYVLKYGREIIYK